MDLSFSIPLPDLLRAALVFIRVGSVIFALPLFGDSPVPVRVRVIFSLALSVCIFPLVPLNWGRDIPHEALPLSLVVFREIAIGLVLGFVARIAFDGLLMAAAIVGYQMGFGTANLFVPDAGEQLNGFTAFHRIIMLLIFLTLDFHHGFIIAISNTFKYIHAGGAYLQGDFMSFFIDLTAEIFLTSIQLAAPILVALMFAMTALGLVARTVPQMNVFTLSFPFSFFIGLAIYAATLPLFPPFLNDHFINSERLILEAMAGLRGGDG